MNLENDFKNEELLDGLNSRDSVELDKLMEILRPVLRDYVYKSQNASTAEGEIPRVSGHTKYGYSQGSGNQEKVLELNRKVHEQLIEECRDNLCLSISHESDIPKEIDYDRFKNLLGTILDLTPSTLNPMFIHKLYTNSSPVGSVTELITALLNVNQHVFDASGVCSLIEKYMIYMLGKMMGYSSKVSENSYIGNDGNSKIYNPFGTHSGLFCPGGSYANLHAILLARNYYFPHLIRGDGKFESKLYSGHEHTYNYHKNEGPLEVFASSHAHYSIFTSAQTIGLPSNCIKLLPSDSKGRLTGIVLEKALKDSLARGSRPFFVQLTGGTTVTGSWDQIEECTKICEKYGVWCHLDACWGGGVAFNEPKGCGCDVASPDGNHVAGCSMESVINSNDRTNYLKGSELCDSISWNPQKLMGVPVLCSVLLVKDWKTVGKWAGAKGSHWTPKFQSDNDASSGGSYLYHNSDKVIGDAAPITADMGAFSIGCSRKSDALKLYMTWSLYGSGEFVGRSKRSINRARLLYDYLIGKKEVDGVSFDRKISGDFMPVLEPEFINVCFWYLPPIQNWKFGQKIITKFNGELGSSADQKKGLITSLDVAKYLYRTDFEAFYSELNRITRSMYLRLMERGKMMLDCSPLSIDDPSRKSQTLMSASEYANEYLDCRKGLNLPIIDITNSGNYSQKKRKLPEFWRVIMCNSRMTDQHVLDILYELDQAGKGFIW